MKNKINIKGKGKNMTTVFHTEHMMFKDHNRGPSKIVLALCLILMLFACSKSAGDRWQEQYDLGQKYLIELDYEQALIAFTNAIEIDPARGEAYIGRGDTYVAIARLSAVDSDRMQSYINARDDFELGISYIDPDWNLVDRIADVYYQIGDIDALESFMTEMHELLGDSEIYDKWIERIASERAEEEPEDNVPETDWDAYEDEIKDELEQANILRQAQDQVHLLSYEQRKEVFEPLAERILVLIDEFPVKVNRYGEQLNDIYYMMGDMDRLMEIREKLYTLTGEEKYNPEGYVINYDNGGGEEYNKYGQKTRGWYHQDSGYDDVSETEYDEHGRMTAYRTSSTEQQIEYDDVGRISAAIDFNSEGPLQRHDYSYNGQEVTVVNQYLWGTSWGNSRGFSTTQTTVIITINKYGRPTHFYQTDMNGEVMDDYDLSSGSNWSVPK